MFVCLLVGWLVLEWGGLPVTAEDILVSCIFMCPKPFLKIMFWVLSAAKDDNKVKTGREKVDVRKWKTWEKWNGPSCWSHITRGLSFQRNHVPTRHLIKEGSLWKLKNRDILFWAYCWENESLTGSTSLGHSYPECETFWVKHTSMIKNNIWKKL